MQKQKNMEKHTFCQTIYYDKAFIIHTFKARFLVFLTNIRLGWKGLPDIHFCMLRKFINYGQRSFITLAPGCWCRRW